jgi:TolB protein
LAVFVMQADGTAQRRLSDQSDGGDSPAWSRDGSTIAFTRWGANGAGLGVFVMDAAGDNVRQIADVQSIDPVWSPDGMWIAVTSVHGYLGEYPQIYLIAADGSGQQRLTSHENVPTPTLSMGNGWPAWSPDGRQIAFISEQLDGPSLVHVMQADGTQVRLLTDLPGRKYGLAWSLDGERLAFSTDSSFTGVVDADIWIMGADGTDPRNLTASTAIEFEPDWSPDGVHLAFVRESGGRYQVAVITADGAMERVLYDAPYFTFGPVWSPDGQRLLFASGNLDPDSEFGFISTNLFVVNADGSGLQQLTTTPDAEKDPTWSPDGSAIVYIREGAPEK